MVFYRKYRPQKIADLDSQNVQETLYAVLGNKERIPHAFLFTGTKGLGKTSTARIVAKVVNCEKSNNGKEPCNECDQCTSITNGTNLDVIEIDGASNRGIDEIRDLREKIRLSPVKASKKVYIIDEVHMLTTEAFNALLKTLEEPPVHSVFILCTTEYHKVPGTIASRCFHIQFKTATTQELVHSLKRIVRGEDLSVEDEALILMAKKADGSFRDAAKNLEEVVSLSSGAAITFNLTQEKLKVVNIDGHIDALFLSLKTKSMKEGFAVVSQVAQSGIDMPFFVQECIQKLHSLLLSIVGVSKEEAEVDFSSQEVKKLLELFGKTYQDTRFSVIVQLPLELLIVEWCMQKGNAPVQNHTQVEPDKNSKVDVAGDIWKDFIDEVKKENHSLTGVLRGCHLKSYEESVFTIETKYTFHKEKLEEKKDRKLMEDILKKLTGQSISLKIELKT